MSYQALRKIIGPALVLAAWDQAQAVQTQTIGFDYTGGIQTWTVPATGVYTITAFGAQGGDNPENALAARMEGGFGARISGDFSLMLGQVLTIAVGGEGSDAFGPYGGFGGGGGGGSFVTLSGAPLVIAGGGGGGGVYGRGGNAGSSGVGGDGHYTAWAGTGGADGSGGGFGQFGGGGGGGFFSDGGGSIGFDGSGGYGFALGLAGGAGGIGSEFAVPRPVGGDGGFGGGGGGGNYSGGGGGGYSGGGGGAYAGGGGGGSFNAGLNQIGVAGFQSGNGLVQVTLIPEPTSFSLLGLGLAAGAAGFATRRRSRIAQDASGMDSSTRPRELC